MDDQYQDSEPCAGVPARSSQGLCPVDPKKKNKVETRTVRFIMKLLPSEKNTIYQRAALAELTPTEYARTKALDVSRTSKDRAPSVERTLLSQALSDLATAAEPLKQIAEALMAGETAIPIRRLELALNRMEIAAEQILKAMEVEIR